MSGWQFGGWPPPAPADGGGAVTFAAVRAALLTADQPVGFNLQSLQSVLDVNGLALNASNTGFSLSVGTTSMGLSTTLNRIAIGLHAGEDASPAAQDFVAIGNGALAVVTNGSFNTALGHLALGAVTLGAGNTAVGYNAGAILNTQNDCAFFGLGAGAASAGGHHLCLGTGAEVADATADRQLSIDNILFSGRDGGGLTKWRFGLTNADTIVTQVPFVRLVSADADSVPVLELEATGANGAAIRVHAGTRDPSGAVTSTNGAYYCRKNGATSALYINRSAGATGTDWSLVTAVP